MKLKYLTKDINVNIYVNELGDARFCFTDGDSGDVYHICTTVSRCWEDEKERVGSELLSWLSLMSDELDESEEGEA